MHKMFIEEQQRIYQGLKEIGEEIGNFYADAVRLVDENCTIASKANLIAHLAREIDGGIRDIFAPDLIKKERQKEVKGIENAGHFASILAALGREKNDKLANEWYDIATKFALIAHRHGAWKETKTIDEILGLWVRYEKILLILVGSFYGIIDRLSHISKMDEPTPEIINTLRNILKNPKYEFHFFVNLKQIKWISYLKAAGYFDSSNAPKKIDHLYPNEWTSIRFLLNIAKQKNKATEDEIIEIYRSICEDYLANKFELHPYTITLFAEIVIELESYSFSKIDKKVFEKFLLSNPSSAWNFHNSYLTEQLPEFYISKQNVEGLKNLLDYNFGYVVYTEENEEFSNLGFSPYRQIHYFLEDYRLKEFVDKYTNGIVSLIGIDAIRIVESIIKNINEVDSYKFSSSTIPSLEPTDQTNHSDDWESSILKFVSNGILVLRDDEIQLLISEYLKSEVRVLNRIAFHIIRERFDILKNLFFEFVAIYKLHDQVSIHEPYILLKEKSNTFSDDEFRSVINWVENIEVHKYSETETDEELLKHKYFQIRRWLSSLQPSNEELKILYLQRKTHYDSLEQTIFEHPEFDSYSSFSSGPEYPLSLEEFEKKNITEQIDYIKQFIPDKGHFHSEEGLSNLLREAFINNPAKYLFDLESFIEVPSLYIHNLVDGFVKILREETLTEPSLVVEFLIKKINNDSFKNEDKNSNYKRWLISSIGTFIETLAQKDSQYNFTAEQLQLMIDFIILLLNSNEFKDYDDKITQDYVTHILNSTQGRLHMALMALSVVWAEKYSKQDEIKWPHQIKDYFTSRLIRKDNSDKDFSIVLCYYFSTLIYLDKNWYLENLLKIFPDDDIHFEYTASSCLSSYTRQYKQVFQILKEASIVKRSLDLYMYDCGPLGSLMNYALLEYNLWGISLENSDSTLLWIIQKKEAIQIEKLIEIIWKSKNLLNDKLKLLWDTIFETISIEPDKFKNANKILTWLVDCINNLNDEYTNKLLKSIEFFEPNDREAFSFIRSVYKLADSNLKNAGVLILETFKKARVSPFLDSELQIFVDKLYKNDLKEIANNLCLHVGDTGQLTLKELYDKNNM